VRLHTEDSAGVAGKLTGYGEGRAKSVHVISTCEAGAAVLVGSADGCRSPTPTAMLPITDNAVRSALKDTPELRTIKTFLPEKPDQLTEWLLAQPAHPGGHIWVRAPDRPSSVCEVRWVLQASSIPRHLTGSVPFGQHLH
jgi:hypothetical protein